MSDIIYSAMRFAFDAHHGQKRKYTGEGYIAHCAEVAAIFSSVCSDEIYIAAAWCHDVIEDCSSATSRILYGEFEQIYWIVWNLSDIDIGNRAYRKRKSRERLDECDALTQSIKVADLISNSRSIVEHDKKFAKVYLEEMRLLLDVLIKADYRLLEWAEEILKINV